MPRTDLAGTQHPTYGDIPADEGYLHIADCPQCVADFDGPVLWYAREIKAAHDSGRISP